MNQLQNYPWLTSLPSLLVIATIGMLTHFLKKNIKGETVTDVKNYFRDNVKSTFVAFVATQIGTLSLFLVIPSGSQMDIVAAFGCGFAFDSFLNKWQSA